MTGEKKRRATYQDIIDAPEHRIAEIIDGELFVRRLHGPCHTIVRSRIGMIIGSQFDFRRAGNWLVVFRPEIHFANGTDEDVLVPEIAGWRSDRVLPLRDDLFFSIAPDWTCEVLSKATASYDRMKKVPVYARAGVPHAWLVHPGFRTLEVFALNEKRWLRTSVHREDARVRAEPFDAIELDIGDWWLDLPRPDRACEGVFAYELEDVAVCSRARKPLKVR